MFEKSEPTPPECSDNPNVALSLPNCLHSVVGKSGGGGWKSTDWAVQAFRHGPSIALVQFRTPAALSYVPLLSWFSPHARENREGTKNCEISNNSGGNSVKSGEKVEIAAWLGFWGECSKQLSWSASSPAAAASPQLAGEISSQKAPKTDLLLPFSALTKNEENVNDDFYSNDRIKSTYIK